MRFAKRHIAIWRVLFGQEHKEERSHAMYTLERLRESQPELFTLTTLVNTWGGMTFRYIAAIKEGTRKMVRMLPETVRKGEFRRKALTLADGRSRWGFPTTFLMDHPTGFWLSTAVPRLEEKVSRNSWKTFWRQIDVQPLAVMKLRPSLGTTASEFRIPATRPGNL